MTKVNENLLLLIHTYILYIKLYIFNIHNKTLYGLTFHEFLVQEPFIKLSLRFAAYLLNMYYGPHYYEPVPIEEIKYTILS